MSRLFVIISIALLSLQGFAQKIEVSPISAETMTKFKTAGALLLKSVQFKDKNGINYLIAATEEAEKDDYTSRTLWIEHFIDSTTKEPKLLMEILDFEKDCPLDNQLGLIEGAFEVTDLDKNGYAEIIFMYKTGCKGDASTLGLKLMVLQNGSKAVVRGTTLTSEFNHPKENIPDATFKQLPRVIQDKANALWSRFEKGYE